MDSITTVVAGMNVELDDHVGYERGDPDAAMFSNSRNGTYPKTVASEIGDIELAVPRDRQGTFTPMLGVSEILCEWSVLRVRGMVPGPGKDLDHGNEDNIEER